MYYLKNLRCFNLSYYNRGRGGAWDEVAKVQKAYLGKTCNRDSGIRYVLCKKSKRHSR